VKRSTYKFLDYDKLDVWKKDRENINAALAEGKIRIVTEHATGKRYLDGKELYKTLGLNIGRAGYINVG
jgi:hypothetical protein